MAPGAGDKYRVAIIGTGGIAAYHADAYNQVERTELVAGADISEARLQEFSQRFGVSGLYRDSMEMLEKEQPDIVSVCTLPDSHCEIVTSIAGHGCVRGILCEKPMALSMGEARRMLSACDKGNVKLAVNHQRRFTAVFRKVRELLESGAIGAVQWLWASVTTEYPDPFVWTTHVTDMMRFYAGDVEWLMGQIGGISSASAPQGGHRYPTSFTASMKFKSGARGLLDFDRNRREMHIKGEKGQILVGFDDGPLRLSTEDSPRWRTLPVEGCGWKDWTAFPPAVEDLLDAIEQDKAPLNNGREGAAALEVLLAVFESARIRRRVDFPLETKEYPLDLLIAEESAHNIHLPTTSTVNGGACTRGEQPGGK